LLYPKEDRSTNSLMFSCRTCHVSEPATSYCVFQNKLNSQVGDTAGVTQDVGNDPTVGLPCVCCLCGDLVDDFPDPEPDTYDYDDVYAALPSS
jgi:DNA-directed RNA polymerase II subunit RPB9